MYGMTLSSRHPRLPSDEAFRRRAGRGFSLIFGTLGTRAAASLRLKGGGGGAMPWAYRPRGYRVALAAHEAQSQNYNSNHSFGAG